MTTDFSVKLNIAEGNSCFHKLFDGYFASKCC